MKRLLHFFSLLVVLSLVLAACSPGATAPQPPDLSNLDPADLVVGASGLDLLEEGESTFIASNGELYAFFFEGANPDLAPEYSDFTVSWSKYDWNAGAWSLWQTFKLVDVGQNYLVPSMKLVDDSYVLQSGEVIISGAYWGEGWCLLDACLLNNYKIQLEFSAGKGG